MRAHGLEIILKEVASPYDTVVDLAVWVLLLCAGPEASTELGEQGAIQLMANIAVSNPNMRIVRNAAWALAKWTANSRMRIQQ